MVDRAIGGRRPYSGDSGNDGNNDGNNSDSGAGRSSGAGQRNGAGDDASPLPPETGTEVVDEPVIPAGSLYEQIPEVAQAEDEHLPFGALGRPVSRHAAFYRGFVTTIGVLVALLLAVTIREAASVLELLLIAAFLAVGLNPIIEFAIRRGIPRGWVVLLLSLVLVAALTAVVIVVGGALRTQIQNLIDDLPQLIKDLRRHKSIAHLDDKYHILSSIQEKIKNPEFVTDYFGGVFKVGVSVLSGAATALIVAVLTLYFLSNLPSLKVALYSLAPASRRERVGQLGDEILRRVGRYVIGAFLVAVLAGTVSLLFLVSVGLAQYALPLALLVALLDVVPLVGSILGAATVCVVCLANSLSIGIAAVVFYLIYETLEGYVVYPRVMRSSVDVPEYVTIIAVLLGGTIGGIVGALLALPLGAAILLLVREVWVRRQDTS